MSVDPGSRLTESTLSGVGVPRAERHPSPTQDLAARLARRPDEDADADLVAFLQLLAETMPGMVAYWDDAERCRFANRRQLEWFDRDPDDLRGLTMAELYGPARYQRERPHVLSALMGVAQSFESRLVTPTGETNAFLTHLVPRTVGGTVVGLVTTVVENTPLLSAQRRLESAHAHLLAERDRADAAAVLFEQLFENAPDAILLVDAAGTVVRANKATLRMFRLRPEQLAARTIDDFLPEEHRPPHVGRRLRYLSTGRRGLMTPSDTVAAVCGDGTRLDVSVSLARIRIDQRWLAIASVRDQSELSQAYKGLEQSNRALEQVAVAQRQFIYIASHDLREPVNTISNFSGLLLEDHGDGLDDTARRYLGYVHKSAERMRALLDDLLGYIRVDQSELRMEPVALNRLAVEVVDDLSATLDRRRATVVVADLPVVSGQPTLLRALLQNLVDNATKFRADDRDPVVEITVMPPSPAAEGDTGRELCEIVIADNGIGIDPGHLDRVFEIFRRSHPYQRFPGSGIGLALCRRVAQLHGGRIWAEPGTTYGTRIHVKLPTSSALPSDDAETDPLALDGATP